MFSRTRSGKLGAPDHLSAVSGSALLDHLSAMLLPYCLDGCNVRRLVWKVPIHIGPKPDSVSRDNPPLRIAREQELVRRVWIPKFEQFVQVSAWVRGKRNVWRKLIEDARLKRLDI